MLKEENEKLFPYINFDKSVYDEKEKIFERYPHIRMLINFDNGLFWYDTKNSILNFYETFNKQSDPEFGTCYGEFFEAYYTTKNGRHFMYRASKYRNDTNYLCFISPIKPDRFAKKYMELGSIVVNEYITEEA
jgi:hypothetical protein